MKLIYVKLNTGVTEFIHDRLSIRMLSTEVPVAVLDYTNLDEVIYQALLDAQIVQITQEEYISILTGIELIPPTVVPTNYLITLAQYYNSCPPDNSVIFLLHGGQFYKMAWSTVKSCVGSTGVKILFRVGDPSFPAPDYPQPGDTTYQNDLLKNKLGSNIRMKINGVEIYQFSDNPDVEYFTPDNLPGVTLSGTLTKPATFKDGEIIEITA